MKALFDSSSLMSCAALLSMAALLLFSACSGSRSATETEEAKAEEVEVGYGSADKSQIVGSVSTIDGEDAQREQPRSLADMLRGRVAGVQVTETPGGGIRVRIRGSRSLLGSNEPLYVVDDMVIQTGPDGALTGINPYDVESISVLKDASATAVYGSRGSNGVILIKTKRGSQ